MKAPLFVLLVVAAAAVAEAADWDSLAKVLDTGIAKRGFPGAVGAVFTKDKVLYMGARGHYTYGIPPPQNPGENPPMELSTMFDMASCSKVIAGTSAAALLYQRGLLSLDARVSDILPGFGSNGKEDIKVINLLLHNAGFPPDPSPGYPSAAFGCPETGNLHPNLTFSCRDKCYASLLTQTLENPVGEKYVYSDLSLITVMNVVGRTAKDAGLVVASDVRADCPLGTPGEYQCWYEAFVRKYVFTPLGMTSSMFLPPRELWKHCAPTENDTNYRHEVCQGFVHDENTYAMGGISGHAGLFTTIGDAVKLARAWLFAPEVSSNFLNAATVRKFTAAHNLTQSSRALGWDTNVDGPESSCGSLSAKTFLHNGFTGTQICCDPERNLATVFLSNRVYPQRDPGKTAAYEARRDFATLAQQLFDEGTTL